jgi:ABC-2 type transport system permease protein
MLRPGGLWWLLRWELLLAWRGYAGRFDRGGKRLGPRRAAFNLLGLLVLLHLYGFSIALVARHLRTAAAPLQLPLLSLGLGVVLLTAAGSALAIAINLLFARGDLDLLCSTPAPVSRVFTARGLGLAVQAAALPAALLLPVANAAAVLGAPGWLGLYAVVAAIGLLAAALGLGLAVLLVRAIGPARARIVGLVLSAVLGAAMLLGVQLPNLLRGSSQPASLSLVHRLHDAAQAAPDSWLWLPARAARGEPLPLLLCLLAATAVFLLVTAALPRGFAHALEHAAGNGSRAAARRSDRQDRQGFRGGLWRLMFAKEWRLIGRDPQLLTLLAQTVIGFIPGYVILLRPVHGWSDAALRGTSAALATLISCVLADTMVWLAVCAEDMPELLACAPRRRGELGRMKLVVILLPLWLLAGAVSLWAAWPSPSMFLAMAACIAGGSLSVGLFHLWLPTPGSRKDIRRRYRRGNAPLSRNLAALAIQAGWSACAWGLASGHAPVVLASLPLALAGPGYAWRERNDGEVLRY